MTGLRIHDDAVGEMAIGNDGLAVRAVEIHRVNAVAAQFENEQAPDRGLGAGRKSCFGSLKFSHVRLQSIFNQHWSDDDPSGFLQKLAALPIDRDFSERA